MQVFVLMYISCEEIGAFVDYKTRSQVSNPKNINLTDSSNEGNKQFIPWLDVNLNVIHFRKGIKLELLKIDYLSLNARLLVTNKAIDCFLAFKNLRFLISLVV